MSAVKPVVNSGGKLRPVHSGEYLAVANGGTGAVDAAGARSALSVYSTTETDTAIATAVTGLLDLKGGQDCSANPNYPAALKGDYYFVTVGGKIGGASGTTVTALDVFFAIADNAGGTQASVGSSWEVIHSSSLAGALLASNNLSDLGSASTARGNLGVAIGSDVQAYDADLAAIAALSGTNTIYYRSAANTWSGVTIGATLSFSAGTLGFDLTHANAWTGKQDLGAGGDLTPAATPATNAIGYLGAPQNTQNASYTTVMGDAGKHLYHTSGSAHTWTIDSNANVAYPIGTILTFVNENAGGVVTLAITSDTLCWGSSTGSRSLAANGTATALKVAGTIWRLTGDGIT